MMPVVDGLETDFGGKVDIFRLDAGMPENQQLMAQYDVFGHPAFAVIDAKGDVVERFIGAQPADALRKAIMKSIGDSS